jgi:polar amino acid transport system substrate-binding protein
MSKDIVLVDTPFSTFSTLSRYLYSHKSTASTRSVEAIRGFSYHVFREELTAQGYEFFDLPTSISAIQFFLKKRTKYLISYRPPVDYFIDGKIEF